MKGGDRLISLFPVDKPGQPPIAGETEASVMVDIMTTDVRAAVRRLKQAGVQPVRKITDDESLFIYTLQDPDGNAWSLYEWPIKSES